MPLAWADALGWSGATRATEPPADRQEPDEGAREQMNAAYLAAWAAFGDPASLKSALDWAAPLSELHVSISWRRIAAVFEPGAFPFVDGGAQRHLEAALAATDGIG